MNIILYTDGGARGNPGLAAVAAVVYGDKHIIDSFAYSIGTATNNMAEYQAVLEALHYVHKNILLTAVRSIEIRSDSNLLVQQLNGFYKIKNHDIRLNYIAIKEIELLINKPTVYRFTPREHNSLADALVNLSLDTDITRLAHV